MFSVSLKVLTLLGLVFSVALYGSAQWLIDTHIITDPRALISYSAIISSHLCRYDSKLFLEVISKASNTWYLLVRVKYLNKSSAYPLW